MSLETFKLQNAYWFCNTKTYLGLSTIISTASCFKLQNAYWFCNTKLIWVYQQFYLLCPACNYFQLPTLTRQTYLGLGVDYQPSSWLPLAMPIHWMKIKQTIWVHSCDYYPFKQILFAWSFISSKEITTMTSFLDDLNSSVTVILPGGIALHNFRTSQINLRHVKSL